MDITDFLEEVKKNGPDIYLERNPYANVVMNKQSIPIRSDVQKLKEPIHLKVYYDEQTNMYRYSEDGITWTDLNQQQMEDIFYNDIKPFIL